jgi:DNA repair exonuclease SbcCD ATPase subunit
MASERWIITVVVAAFIASACGEPAPAPEPAREDAAAARATEMERDRNEETAELEKRAVDLELRLSEMESKLAQKAAGPTAALRAEVKEDVKNVREAVADLKTTRPENWWERHEQAMERTADDIEADVRRLAGRKGPATTERTSEPPTAAAAPFTSRRDAFVTRLRSRVDQLAEQLKQVRASRARETELEDTRARLEKLRDDVDRLGNASADDWWSISRKRVSDYIDRVESSIGRLDDNTRS